MRDQQTDAYIAATRQFARRLNARLTVPKTRQVVVARTKPLKPRPTLPSILDYDTYEGYQVALLQHIRAEWQGRQE